MKKVAVGALVAVLALLCWMLLAAPCTQDDVSMTGAAAKGLLLLDDEQGVYVLAVTDKSPAALAGVEPGDYLLSAGGLPIDKAQRLDEMMAQMKEPLQLRLRRNNAEVLITLPVR